MTASQSTGARERTLAEYRNAMAVDPSASFYGPASHYPTTAELAAFRRTFAPHYGSALLRRDSPFMAPDTCATLYGARPHTYGAWPHEREHGIGSVGEPNLPGLGYDCARHEANRIRRARFDSQTGWLARAELSDEIARVLDARETFAPGSAQD